VKIKAISIVAPSGSKIASGEKTLEVRKWVPDLTPHEDILIVENKFFLGDMISVDPDGYALAVVKIVHVRPFTLDDLAAACASSFEDGWFAWELSDVRPLANPISALAARKIYELDIGNLVFG
jgi:hypothetical protein